MAVAELSILKIIAAAKTALLGVTKFAIVAGPIRVPLVIVGGVGTVLAMNIATAQTVRVIRHDGASNQ